MNLEMKMKKLDDKFFYGENKYNQYYNSKYKINFI